MRFAACFPRKIAYRDGINRVEPRQDGNPTEALNVRVLVTPEHGNRSVPGACEKGKYAVNVLSLDDRVQPTAALVEGNSIRSTERLTGKHRDTVMRWGLTIGEACRKLHDERINGLYTNLLQLDEIWSFVHTKEKRRREDDPAEYGDEYVFVGIDATSKLVVGYRVGKRDGANTSAFCVDLRKRIIGAPQVSTDGFKPCREAIEQAFGSRVHHGVAVKLYEDEEGKEHRYAPGRCIGIERSRVSGSPIEENISTSYVERQNGTIRQGIRRLTRLTNAFSKTLRGLEGAVNLHFGYYNFCRVHGSLRTTPAMAAGLTDRIWTIRELVEIALTAPDPSNDNDPPSLAATATRPPPVLRLIAGGKTG